MRTVTNVIKYVACPRLGDENCLEYEAVATG